MDDTAVEVWPDNLSAVNTFIAMGTQWRTGAMGATGLDYAALPAVMRLTGIPRCERPAVLDGLRIMEAEALKIMGERRG